MKKISMQDIARELNISITTVSFVVNGKNKEKGISAETTKRVNDLIKKRGFNPNASARALRTGKSHTIVLIVEDISNSFFGSIAKYIEAEAHKNGYKIFYGSTDNKNSIAESLISNMKNSAVDGFIITPTKNLLEEITQLKKENIPFVLIDRTIPGIEVNTVTLDNYSGAYNLTRHLADNGYQHIGFITLSEGMSQMEDRKRGYLEALNKNKQHPLESSLLEVSFQDTDVNVIESIQQYLKKNKKLDALFFATNYLGINGLEALQKSKINIPGDIAVVSFDDNTLFRLTTPSITVAAQPVEEIASSSIDLLLKSIKKKGKVPQPVGVVLQPTIIIRNSSPKKSSH
jgi:LacI family transcriptional regulator